MGYRSAVTAHVRRSLLAAIPVVLGCLDPDVLAAPPAARRPGRWSCWATPETRPERIAELRAQLGLDDPLVVQYARFLGNLLRGDLGRSIRSNRPVFEEIRQQAPNTIALTLAGLGLAVVLGIPLGVLGAYHAVAGGAGSIGRASRCRSLGVSLPSFWLGMLLIFVFALWLGWLPATGQGGPERLILPGPHAGRAGDGGDRAGHAREDRRGARAGVHHDGARQGPVGAPPDPAGRPQERAWSRSSPSWGSSSAPCSSGSVIIENVFARQGMGRLAVEAILNRDVPVVQGVVLVAGVAYVLINLLVDLVCAALDPRIRYE